MGPIKGVARSHRPHVLFSEEQATAPKVSAWGSHEQKLFFVFGDFLHGFNPLLKYIFGENIYKGPTIKEAFDVEDLLECVNIVCKAHTKEQAATKIQNLRTNKKLNRIFLRFDKKN